MKVIRTIAIMAALIVPQSCYWASGAEAAGCTVKGKYYSKCRFHEVPKGQVNRGNRGGSSQSDGWLPWITGGVGAIGGFIVGRETAPTAAPAAAPPQQVVVQAAVPDVVVYKEQPPKVIEQPPIAIVIKAFTPDWYDYCAGKYKSFEAHTGFYTTYEGERRFCR